MDVEQQLRTALHDGARDLEINGRGAEAARGRARRRARRRRAVPAALTATMVGVGVVAWSQRPDEPSTLSVASGGPTLDAGAGLSDVTLDWRAVPATVVNKERSFVGSDGTHYLLSTAPGTNS